MFPSQCMHNKIVFFTYLTDINFLFVLWVFQIFNKAIEGMHAHANKEINQMQHLQKKVSQVRQTKKSYLLTVKNAPKNN